ncbi:MAG: DNA translocase FtsK [Candidatus Dependentiae bacterium]|nr:DNA translocase FtsK [Candidatus Dependentiae bacterium]
MLKYSFHVLYSLAVMQPVFLYLSLKAAEKNLKQPTVARAKITKKSNKNIKGKPMLRPQYTHKSYMNEIKAVGLLGIAVFIACSLYSYNAHDCSFIHYSTRPIADTHNWCGMVGAQCAAVLLYLFGAAAFLVCGLLMGGVYMLIKKSSLIYEWDRVCAGVGLLIVSACLCSMYQIDMAQSNFTGGLIGIRFMSLLYQLCDYVGGMVCAHVLLYMCLIIVCRFSFMGSVRGVIKAVRFCCFFVRKHQLFSRINYGACTVFGYMRKPCLMSYRFIGTLLDGTAFEGTALMAPDGAYGADSLESKLGRMQKNAAFIPAQSAAPVTDSILTDEIAGAETVVKAAPLSGHVSSEVAPMVDKQPVKYVLPPISFFIKGAPEKSDSALTQELEARARLLQEKLERFGIKGTIVAIKRGPVVTLFEYEPHIDAKLSKIIALEDDLAMALKALSIRILAPIPGRAVVGFEVANAKRVDVLLADTIHSREYTKHSGHLPLILGQDTVGNTVIVDLVRMPHLLVAGSTGSGKSVGLNAMLISLLCARTPDELKLILIDPKRLEFTAYEDIAHLLFPIITNTKMAAPVLKWVARQMDERYEKMAACGARNIFDYNAQCDETGNVERMPFIVVMIDELADLMITVGREVEDSIARITQMARAAGIHLIVATQRPSVDVITGVIKVNFPSRISFRVTSRIDSRTILDCGGADKLLGRGDMLFLDSTTATLRRVHGAYVSDAEIAQVTGHIRSESTVNYFDIHTELAKGQESLDAKDDALYGEVLHFLDEIESLSISSLQRKFKIGYNRSARIIDQLESTGRIMPTDGSKTRRVIK